MNYNCGEGGGWMVGLGRGGWLGEWGREVLCKNISKGDLCLNMI